MTTGAVLYDQLSNVGTTSYTSQDFEPFFDSFDNQLADDFDVPAGDTWRIDGVNVIGTGSVSFSSTVDVWFYTDASGMPGTTVCFYPDVIPTNRPSPSMDINLPSPCLLSSGTYWVSVQVNQNFATFGSWFWMEVTSLQGSPAMWQNPGDGYGTGCTTWGRRGADCNFGVTPDQAFQLEGIVGGPDLEVTKRASNLEPVFGETVDFTVTVANTDPNAGATDIVVDDLLAAGLDFVAARADQGTYDPASGHWEVGTLGNGSHATLVIQATLNTLDPVGNTASLVQSSPFDPNPDNNSDSVTLDPRGADLSIDKTVSDGTPALGDEVLFSVTVTHQDGRDVRSMRVRDRLPQGLGYVGHTASQGTYDPADGNWRIGAMQEGETVILDVTALVGTTAPLTNTAFIAFANEPDPFPGDNTDAASVNAVAADLELRQRVTALSHAEGTITAAFEVEVANEGPSATGGVEVSSVFSSAITIVSMEASQGVVAPAGAIFSWSVGTLDVGHTAALLLVVALPQDETLTNTAEVTAADLSDIDSVPGDGEGDDFAVATTRRRSVPDFVPEAGPGGVIGRGNRLAADLALTAAVDDEAPAAGADVVYTIDVENLGPQATAKVTVTDRLPGCLAFALATAEQGQYDPDTGVWTIGRLTVNQRVRLEVTAQVTEDCTGTVTNTASITTSSLPEPRGDFSSFGGPSPALENNSDAVAFTVATSGRVAGNAGTLEINYPNPFNPQTVIPFRLAEAGLVTVKVYDLLGRTVATLVDGRLPAGAHEAVFEAGHLATGMYLVRMETAGVVHTQRVTLMK